MVVGVSSPHEAQGRSRAERSEAKASREERAQRATRGGGWGLGLVAVGNKLYCVYNLFNRVTMRDQTPRLEAQGIRFLFDALFHADSIPSGLVLFIDGDL